MDVVGGVIGAFYLGFGAFMISSPSRRERVAQAGAGFHRRMWGNAPLLNRFGEIALWRSLVVIIGVLMIVIGVLVAAHAILGLDWFA
jgi:hypothetical protein